MHLCLLPSTDLCLVSRVVPQLYTTAAEEDAVREPTRDTWLCLVAVSF